ncbi:type II toxin-antitoxin system VapC family toxin [Nevskia soli]|jgi:predicted nucleic acid-binding protein|uniref:type II toxin-antitoxin system VapC family toxin n=1 Tax=Nevskia soli TaxID=418856 RepID=UPI0015D78ABA|nr:type II toxin-antitoxin system VapC family toxin [Nevskia soli]
MIVLDASVVVELLRNGVFADGLRRDLAANPGSVIAPHLLDVEVVSALRSLHAGRRIDTHDSQQYLNELAALPVERVLHIPLIPRVWELRHNFSAYDAVYIALAEATDAVLFTMDAKLRTGHRAKVRLFSAPVN